MQHKKYAFTLVELIVVITILAILGTLSFVYFQSYTQNARDGVRVSDMGTIKKSLGIYVIQRGSYPEPSDGVDITYSGATIWTQGTFGESMFRNLSTVNKVPTDPLSSSNYTYSVLGDRQEYQLAGVLESPVLSQTLPLPQAAASTDLVQSYIIGNYNGMVTKVSTGGTDYVLAVPSLISTDLGYTDIIEVIGNKLLTYDGYAKVAASFSGRYQSSQEYNFTPSRVLVYSGDITSLIDGQEQITLLKNIQEAYSGTIVAQDDVQIKNITNLEVSQQDPSSKAKVLACNIINFQLKYYVDCNDIDFIVFYIVNVLHIDISNIPGNTIQAVFQSTDDALRFGTDAGIAKYDGSDWTIYTTDDGLVHNHVLSISEDLSGNMWFGTNLGISMFDGTDWTTYNTGNSDLLHNHILYIYTAADGKIWIGTNKGVSTYDSGLWEDYTKKKDGLSHDHVNTIYQDTLGFIWFGTDVGLDKYDDGTITTYKTTDGLPSNNVTYILEDENTDLWFGTNAGLSIYDRTTFTNKTVANTSGGLPSNTITYIYEDAVNNTFWIGTDAGVAKYIPGTESWTVYDTGNQLSGNYVHSIYENDDNDIIIINDGGVDTIN